MCKAVLISIRPEWCEKIVNGKKTIEVRKTRPKLEPPFKCYIYCTNGYLSYPVGNGMVCHLNGGMAVIGEFVCDRIEKYQADNYWYGTYDIDDDTVRETCLVNGALWEYAAGADLYGWHISDLVIYDKPKSLREFTPVCKFKQDDGTCPTRLVACSYQNCDYNQDGSINIVECGRRVTRPPQSWCYVEVLHER